MYFPLCRCLTVECTWSFPIFWDDEKTFSFAFLNDVCGVLHHHRHDFTFTTPSDSPDLHSLCTEANSSSRARRSRLALPLAWKPFSVSRRHRRSRDSWVGTRERIPRPKMRATPRGQKVQFMRLISWKRTNNVMLPGNATNICTGSLYQRMAG
jgi:hypothetical protein